MTTAPVQTTTDPAVAPIGTNLQPGQQVPNVTNVPTTAANPGGVTPGATGQQTAVTPAPAVNPDGSTQLTAAQIQAQADSAAAGVQTSSAGVRTSASIEAELEANLASLGAPPAVPDESSELTSDNAAPGSVNDITSQLNDAQNTESQLEISIQQQQAGEASKPGVVAALVGGRMKMISAENAYALAEAKANVTSLTKNLTQAQTAVKTIMAAQDTDYKNAESQYTTLYTKYLSQYTSEEDQLNKDQTAAKANASVIIASYKGSTAGTNSITPDQQAQWNQLDLEAGQPEGTTYAAVVNNLTVDKFTKGNDGYTYVSGTDANGVPYVARVVGSFGSAPIKSTPSGDQPSPTDPGLNNAQAAQAKAFGTALLAGQSKMQGTNGVTREQFIRELEGDFPTLNPTEIQNWVYTTYPDNWQTSGVNTSAASSLTSAAASVQ